MNKMMMALGAGVVFAGLGLVDTADASWGVNYSIHSTTDENLCLDVKHDGKGAGTPVQVYSCNKTEAQRWAFTRGTDNWGHLVGPGGLCVSVHDNGHSAYSYGCSDGDSQKFKFEGSHLVQKGSNKCVSAPSLASGQGVDLAPCDTGKNLTWKFQRE